MSGSNFLVGVEEADDKRTPRSASTTLDTRYFFRIYFQGDLWAEGLDQVAQDKSGKAVARLYHLIPILYGIVGYCRRRVAGCSSGRPHLPPDSRTTPLKLGPISAPSYCTPEPGS